MKVINYILAAVFLLFSGLAYAQTPTNYGFEDGTYAGWNVSNGSGTVKSGGWSGDGSGVQVTTGMTNFCPGGGKCWTVTPYGTYMAVIQAGGGSPTFDSAMSTLGLTGSAVTTIKNTIYANGGMNPTNASSISKSVFLQAGVTYTFAWQYVSTDYMPYNDGSIITLTGGSGVPTINGQTQNYALLGFTNTGTGNYSTNSYGATGWQVAQFTVQADGTYLLGFASFNLGDTILSPMLFIDQLQGTTLLNGTTFTPIQPNSGSSAPPPPAPEPTYPAATISANQQFKINQTNSIANNSVYVNSTGDYNSVFIEQKSFNNQVRGINNNALTLNGSYNSVTINQGTATTILGKNLAEVSISGSNNTITLNQHHNNKYAELNILASNSIINSEQKDTGGKSLFLNVQGTGNNITTLQQGNGNHFLQITSPYGNANVNASQSGNSAQQFQLILNSPGIGVSINQSISTGNSALMEITCNTPPCTGYSYTKN
jgi:hypothetical protein